MNLSAPFLCEFYKKPMNAALPYVDILFGNETEAETFSTVNELGTKDIKEIALAVTKLEKINDKRKRIVIFTQGHGPVILAKDNTVTEFPVEQVPGDKVVDTNGAGDAFVGGIKSLVIISLNCSLQSIRRRESNYQLLNLKLFYRIPGSIHPRKELGDLYKMRHLGGDSNNTEVWMYLRRQA